MIIKNHAVGINASDVNFTAGAYLPGVRQGFELTKIYQKINVNLYFVFLNTVVTLVTNCSNFHILHEPSVHSRI